MPDAMVVAPSSLEAAAEILAAASATATPVLFWGGGTHQGYGYPVDAGIVVSTERLDRVVDWQPDDLTIVVEAGITLARLDELLAERKQSAVLPEAQGEATIGGVVAAAISGFRRLRYGPTRDRMLESVMVTGDGRITTAGGRVVKNVTGYDIPRLVTGSFGSLGLIGRVCLKLWPDPAAAAAMTVPDAAVAADLAYRPLAVLETNTMSSVYVAGTEQEVIGRAAEFGVDPVYGFEWPQAPAGVWRAVVRVPPSEVVEAVARLRRVDGLSFLAGHGVGEIHVGASHDAAGSFGELRSWAESVGGAFVVAGRPEGDTLFDPWGTPPGALDLQRRVKAAFDPAGIANPGRLPGRI